MKAASLASIPFKSESEIGTSHLAGAIAITAILLAVVFLVLKKGNKMGWLSRWQTGSINRKMRSEASWEVDSQRISRASTVHTLRRHGRTIVVVESAAHITLVNWEGGSEVSEDKVRDA